MLEDHLDDAHAQPLSRAEPSSLTLVATDSATAVPVTPAHRASSESARPDPEALLPRAARRNGLKLGVTALLREIRGVGDAGHRLDADEVAILPHLPGAADCRRG